MNQRKYLLNRVFQPMEEPSYGKTELKVKGFSLNCEGSTQLQYDLVRDNIISEIKKPFVDETKLKNPASFLHDETKLKNPITSLRKKTKLQIFSLRSFYLYSR